MLKNYLKVAFRNLLRNKTFSAINIIGLSLGMTCSLLILLWVKDERGMDSFTNIGIKNPIGQPLTCLGKKGTIIGVVKDFHFNSLHKPIAPLVIAYGVSEGNTILIRTKAGMSSQSISSLEKECKLLNPKFPFTYQFSDEAYQRLYSSEDLIGKLSYLFAFLAIFISCIGLLGLAESFVGAASPRSSSLVTFAPLGYTTEQRGKEIAIRKVLGANLTDKWLQDYAYRTNISGWIFIAAGTLSLLITLATVSFHVLKAAMTAPRHYLAS